MNGDFDDEQVAAVVRRCWGGERAPADLRRRIADLMAAERVTARPSVWQRAFWPVATAATVLLALGGVLRFNAPGPSRARAAVLPASLEAELVQTHDHCCQSADHQRLPVPRSNGYAIAASLRSRLHRPVLVSHPADAGWRFAGASVCPVGGVRSAHLVFRRADGDALSIFSLPRSCAPAAADGQQFQAQADGHLIVGFVRHGAVYCLVGTGCATDVSVARLADIRQQMEQEVVVADAPAPVLPPDGELIYGTGR